MNRTMREMIKLHRMLFVLSSIGLAVTASRVATDPSEVSSLLFLLASACLIAVADWSKDIDLAARDLAAASAVGYTDSLRDLLAVRGNTSIKVGIALSCALLFAGITYGVAL